MLNHSVFKSVALLILGVLGLPGAAVAANLVTNGRLAWPSWDEQKVHETVSCPREMQEVEETAGLYHRSANVYLSNGVWSYET